MTIIIAFSRAIILGTGTLVLMMRLFIHSKIERNPTQLGFEYRRKWGKFANRILGIKIVEKKILTQDQTVLYVSNHRSMTDPMVQTSVFDSYIIAKNEVGSLPIIGKGAAMTGIILVNRSQLRSRLEARNQTQDLLKDGKSVLVYAEGTTGTEKTTIDFKIGTFKAAATLGIPVVPIAIEYRDPKDFWATGGLLSQLTKQVGRYSTHVKLRMGEPICDPDATQLMLKTKNWIDEQLLDMQSNWSRQFIN